MGSFTYNYHQPDDYHFCQDSVLFPRLVADALQTVEISPEYRVLDVCAGCGVLGLELAFHEPRLTQIDFLEIQEEFREYFERNRLTAQREDSFRFLAANYEILLEPSQAGQYDLIIANPPYFFANEGRQAPAQSEKSRLQNRCRFFIDSDLPKLLLGCANALKPNGQAFLLMKSGKTHGRNALREASLTLAGIAAVTLAGNIRGTEVLHLRPLPNQL